MFDFGLFVVHTSYMYPSRQSEACWLPKMSLVRININISIPSDLTVLVLFSTELPYLTLPHCSCPTADTCLPYLGTHCEFSLQGPHLQYLHPITKHLQAPPSTSKHLQAPRRAVPYIPSVLYSMSTQQHHHLLLLSVPTWTWPLTLTLTVRE